MKASEKLWPRLKSEKGLRIIVAASPFLLIMAGIVLSIFSLMSDLEIVSEEVLEGRVAPGEMLGNLNRTDYGIVSFTAEEIPCPLFIYPLTKLEHMDYSEGKGLPARILDCDNSAMILDHQVSHLVLRNVDLTDAMNYTLRITYYRSTQPFPWIVFPAVGLLIVGTSIVVTRMLTRGILQITEEFEKD